MKNLREKELHLAKEFLTSSIDQKTKGSRAFYSRIRYPFEQWSAPYPETTGYIIPTFIDLCEFDKSLYSDCGDSATEMGEWLLSIQAADGAFPGGLWKGEFKVGSVFNTAQIIKGLIRLYLFTNDDKYKVAFANATSWIVSNQNDDGTWTKFSYSNNFFPSYYAQVAWPVLWAGTILNNEKFIVAANLTYGKISERVLPNKGIQDWGFKPNADAFLHTIAYTIRGFLEGYLLCGNQGYLKIAIDISEVLLKKYEIKKKLGGAYGEDLKPVSWYRCLTGEVQTAIIWVKISSITKDFRYLNGASKLIDDVVKTQPKRDMLFLKKGGIMGSKPYYGRYISFRQPNWATKYLIDAILEEANAYRILGEDINGKI
jgi:hypothetical protein